VMTSFLLIIYLANRRQESKSCTSILSRSPRRLTSEVGFLLVIVIVTYTYSYIISYFTSSCDSCAWHMSTVL